MGILEKVWDISVGHEYNMGGGSYILNLYKGFGEHYCQRYALPAELQPHDSNIKYFILASIKFIVTSINLPRLFSGFFYLMSHEKT